MDVPLRSYPCGLPHTLTLVWLARFWLMRLMYSPATNGLHAAVRRILRRGLPRRSCRHLDPAERTEAKQGVEPGERDDPFTYQITYHPGEGPSNDPNLQQCKALGRQSAVPSRRLLPVPQAPSKPLRL
jgi:hypothetical protein